MTVTQIKYAITKKYIARTEIMYFIIVEHIGKSGITCGAKIWGSSERKQVNVLQEICKNDDGFNMGHRRTFGRWKRVAGEYEAK